MQNNLENPYFEQLILLFHPLGARGKLSLTEQHSQRAVSLSAPAGSTCHLSEQRNGWDADARVQAAILLHPSDFLVNCTRAWVIMEEIPGVHASLLESRVLTGGETRAGLSGNVVINEFQVDLAKVDWSRGQRNQRDRLLNRLKE